MLKRWQIVALGTTAIAIIVFAGSFLFPATYYVCGPDDYSHAKDCSQYHLGPAIAVSVVAYADIHNGLITAFATAGLVLVTYLLVKLGKEQSRITQAQIRASIAAESPGLADGPSPPGAVPTTQTGCPITHITIRNTGDTTAHDVRHFSNVIFANVGSDGRVLQNALVYPADMGAVPTTTIAKNGITILSRNLGRALSAPEISQLGASPSGHAIILYGRITYNDAFRIGHTTDYCLGYAGAYPPPVNFIWTFMTNGNYSD